ncbi:MAG: hypothetical protein KAJ12_10785 [Bacteroidetes bacterium]|nr:hypothetical protein [Bacteroidota bacterium]
MSMTLLAKAIGILLTLLGIIAYLASGGASITALIPAFFGIPLFFLGYASRNEKLRKHLMHVAALLTLVGFIGSIGGIGSLIGLLTGGEVERLGAAVAQSIMALFCLVFLIFAVRSFIEARRQSS